MKMEKLCSSLEIVQKEDDGVGVLKHLKLVSVIGFSGGVREGLVYEAINGRIFYPLGSTIISVQNLKKEAMSFLSGHNYEISCLHLTSFKTSDGQSRSILSSGEAGVVGSKASVYVWDALLLTKIGTYCLHHSAVAAVRVAPEGKFVVSLGGPDDQSIIVWDVNQCTSVCAYKRSNFGQIRVGRCLAFISGTPLDQIFVVGGVDFVQLWHIRGEIQHGDKETACLVNLGVTNFGKLKRRIDNITVLQSEDCSTNILCGTSTGDVLQMWLSFEKNVADTGELQPRLFFKGQVVCLSVGAGKGTNNRILFGGGVTSIVELKRQRQILIGSGDGHVIRLVSNKRRGILEKRFNSSVVPQFINGLPRCTVRDSLSKDGYCEIKSYRFSGSITSLVSLSDDTVLIGCSFNQWHILKLLTHDESLVSCNGHTAPIRDVSFPKDLDIFLGTCGEDGLRLWNLKTCEQIFHVHDHNVAVNRILFISDGSAILSAWEDGTIRAFTPETGRKIFTINGAHTSSVTALIYLNSGALISGAASGHLRTWQCSRLGMTMTMSRVAVKKPFLISTFKEQQATISCLTATADAKECISASLDGTCIIWDISNLKQVTRKHKLIGTGCGILSCAYHQPLESQILTLSTDNSISYWEAADGIELRRIQLGRSNGRNISMFMTSGGHTFLTASKSSIVQVWRYNEATLEAMGNAYCGTLNMAIVSPNGNIIVAVSESGGIFWWMNN